MIQGKRTGNNSGVLNRLSLTHGQHPSCSSVSWIVVVRAVSAEMPSPSTPIAGVARPCIVAAGVDVVGIAVVVVVVVLIVSLTLILGRISPAEPCSVSPSVATGAMELPTFSLVMETALVAFGKITGIGS